jgi:hypothetical protein
MTQCIQAVVNPNHPRAYCCGTPDRCRGTILIAVGIILALAPLILGACRLGNVQGLDFLSKRAAKVCIALCSTFIILFPNLILCGFCCAGPVMDRLVPGGKSLVDQLN